MSPDNQGLTVYSRFDLSLMAFEPIYSIKTTVKLKPKYLPLIPWIVYSKKAMLQLMFVAHVT